MSRIILILLIMTLPLFPKQHNNIGQLLTFHCTMFNDGWVLPNSIDRTEFPIDEKSDTIYIETSREGHGVNELALIWKHDYGVAIAGNNFQISNVKTYTPSRNKRGYEILIRNWETDALRYIGSDYIRDEIGVKRKHCITRVIISEGKLTIDTNVTYTHLRDH